MKEVIIIGASGHGKVVADIVQKSGDKVIGFLDDNRDLAKELVGFPVLGGVEQYLEYLDKQFVIAIGNANIREKIAGQLDGVRWYTAIHPAAVISSIEVEIKEGTVVMANAVVNSAAKIGRHCIINTGAIVEHDNILEDYVHISPNAALAGTVRVGKRTHIGVGASVKNNVTVAADVTVGAGAVVVRDIEEAGVYVGVPAGRKRERYV